MNKNEIAEELIDLFDELDSIDLELAEKAKHRRYSEEEATRLGVIL